MLQENTRPLVKEMIQLKKKLAPLEERMEECKDLIRDIGPDTYTISGLGEVKVSEPSLRTLKGYEYKVDEILLNEDPKLKQRLIELGILDKTPIYTRASKSKVEVKPNK
jgi:hypothetical protein